MAATSIESSAENSLENWSDFISNTAKYFSNQFEIEKSTLASKHVPKESKESRIAARKLRLDEQKAARLERLSLERVARKELLRIKKEAEKKEHKKNIGLSSQSHQTNTEHARQSRGRTTGNLFVMIDISSHD